MFEPMNGKNSIKFNTLLKPMNNNKIRIHTMALYINIVNTNLKKK